MGRSASGWTWLLLAASWLGGPFHAARAADVTDDSSAEGVEFFESKIRPLLTSRCLKCHGADKPKGGLSLTSRARLLTGGDSGPVVIPGEPDQSLLLKALTYAGDIQMPPDGKLPESEITLVRRWVKLGLAWPASAAVDRSPAADVYRFTAEQRNFWSFQPVRVAPPPAVRRDGWAKSPIDRYILARLEGAGLTPAAAASRRALLRRATFDLTGLPPTREEMRDFLADDSTEALATVVDRLLASSRYGERWGRHWLDVVRYADSRDARSFGTDGDMTEAWRYRDWVVNAFNRDLPYDQFIAYQIAGDLLPPPGAGAAASNDRINVDGLVATELLSIGEWGGGDADKEKMLTDIVDDQINVVSRSFLGLTIACARCHDHKFDPIPTADYYSLAGIFFSTHILPSPGQKTSGSPPLRTPLLSPAELEKRKTAQAELAQVHARLNQAVETEYRDEARKLLPKLGQYLLAGWDFQHQLVGQDALTSFTFIELGDFAASRGLRPDTLKKCANWLATGESRLLNEAILNFHGVSGLHAWKLAGDTPTLTINTTNQPLKFATSLMPPHSLAVHPGPTSAVAIRWRSPTDGLVRVTGRLTDADANCGDGIQWKLALYASVASRQALELAGGPLANGKSVDFEGAQAVMVNVAAGEILQLGILPGTGHVCDTTLVDWEIAEVDGVAQQWRFTADLLADPLEDGHGNPHADRYGHEAVWSFCEVLNEPAAVSGLEPWLTVQEAAGSDAEKRDRLVSLADALGKTFGGGAKLSAADERLAVELTAAGGLLALARSADQSELSHEARQRLAQLSAEATALKAATDAPVPMALAAQEGGVPESAYAGFHDARIHLRGSYARLGDTVPRRMPRILAGDEQPPIHSGSGRRELAAWIASPSNPLTARVMANRVWQYHMGQGLVRTPSNFGKLGERPTHPELLDYLADLFVRSGWSLKALHRAIVLSAVYQQSTEASADDLRIDPDNRLWGRMNRRRLDSEAIRDSLLCAAGRLDEAMGGPAVREFSNRRRTLYLMTMRSDRSGFGPLFDAADPEVPTDQRNLSTVAPQALFLLNHPFVLEQTSALVERASAAESDQTARVQWLYEILYGRPAEPREVAAGHELLASLRAATGEPRIDAAAAWKAYCQVLLCANEFLYVD